MSGDLRATALAALDLGGEVVELPEWGITVFVRGLTVGEVEEMARGVTAESNGTNPNLMATVVVRCTLDKEGGTRIFGDDDIEPIAGKATAPVKRIFEAAERSSGIGETDAGNA